MKHQKTQNVELTKNDALRAYARMMNNLDVRFIEPLLADDFHYESQWVLTGIESKQEYLDYIKPKLESILKSGSKVYAEMAELRTYPQGPCIVMAQGSKDTLVATVLTEVENGKIKRIDMCFIPAPADTKRSAEYPR